MISAAKSALINTHIHVGVDAGLRPSTVFNSFSRAGVTGSSSRTQFWEHEKGIKPGALMRVVRIIILIPLAALSFRFLVNYGREVYPLWGMVGSWTFFLSQPYVGTVLYSGETNRCLLFNLVADGPGEGGHIVYYFPSWPLAVAAAGVLVYAFLTAFGRSERSETNPAAQPTARSRTCCRLGGLRLALPEHERSHKQ